MQEIILIIFPMLIKNLKPFNSYLSWIIPQKIETNINIITNFLLELKCKVYKFKFILFFHSIFSSFDNKFNIKKILISENCLNFLLWYNIQKSSLNFF